MDAFDRLVADARNPLPFRRLFDRVLVDAPCSGTGTLARNPEIKWRLKPDDLEDLPAKQRRILSNALDCLAPGGVLVYSTCSVEPEENRQVVERVLRGAAGVAGGRVVWTVCRGAMPAMGFLLARLLEAGSARVIWSGPLWVAPGDLPLEFLHFTAEWAGLETYPTRCVIGRAQ